MRALCVGRHQFLSEHLCRFFDSLGLDTVACVGMVEAAELARTASFDVVIADYDLLATTSLGDWEKDPACAGLAIIAVSMTRHPGEAHLLDVNGIAGFLYLPTLDAEHAHQVLSAVRRDRTAINPPNVLPWPGTTPVAQLR